MNQLRIGVALACHNRREKTRVCLDALLEAAARVRETAGLQIVITDDASTDGTAAMIRERFPSVEIIEGSGKLFWAGGMRLAYGRLLERGLDHYLWLNDDTVLFPEALETLLSTHRAIVDAIGRAGIIVGSTCDEVRNVSYGGLRRRTGKLGALSFERVAPEARALRCDTHNGNVVLVSAQAAACLGNLDAAFRHGMADMDYGLRARAAGVPVWVAPGYAGQCIIDHTLAGSFKDKSLPLALRWRLLNSPKGLPFAAWLLMCRRHAGVLWPIHFAWPYVSTMLPGSAPLEPVAKKS